MLGCSRRLLRSTALLRFAVPLACNLVSVFLESTFTDQNNPKRQTADPLWGSPKLDLSTLCLTLQARTTSREELCKHG